VLLVEVDKRKRQRDVKGARLVRVGGTFARLERDHQINPAGRSLRFEGFDEVDAEDFAEQLLELSVNPYTPTRHEDLSSMRFGAAVVREI